jgi:predicted small metal-binding protein
MDEHRMNALKELMESLARHIKSRHVTMFGELGSNYLLDATF